jgi:adenine-specific DNA-methyltransferase
MRVAAGWDACADVSLHLGDTLELLRVMPAASVQLVITSPPYNIAKAYERGSRAPLEDYLAGQGRVIDECVRILRPGGSICWQVGNHVTPDEIVPLDVALHPIFKRYPDLFLRNRVVWHFEHGLHCTRRLSGRHEVILWFTKGAEYVFHLDPIRVPQKYPGKRAWKGKRVGEYTGNPLGKNPGDVWTFPNVKANHIEKTSHPCQFPIELVERFLLATTDPGDLVLDPYMGVGTTACAAVLHGRRAAGAEIVPEYVAIARERLAMAAAGTLRSRPMSRPVHQPNPRSLLARRDEEPGRPAWAVRPRAAAQGLRITSHALAPGLEAGAAEPAAEASPRQLALID